MITGFPVAIHDLWRAERRRLYVVHTRNPTHRLFITLGFVVLRQLLTLIRERAKVSHKRKAKKPLPPVDEIAQNVLLKYKEDVVLIKDESEMTELSESEKPMTDRMWFNLLMGFFIVANTVFIAVQTDTNV